MNNHVTVLEIDANAIKHNLNFFKQKVEEKTKVMVVVKAFGYGSDGVEVAKIVKDDVDYFAVAYAYEGEALRKAGIENPIMVFNPQIDNIECIVANRLEPALYNFKILSAFFNGDAYFGSRLSSFADFFSSLICSCIVSTCSNLRSISTAVISPSFSS